MARVDIDNLKPGASNPEDHGPGWEYYENIARWAMRPGPPKYDVHPYDPAMKRHQITGDDIERGIHLGELASVEAIADKAMAPSGLARPVFIAGDPAVDPNV